MAKGKDFDIVVAGRAGIDLNPLQANCSFAQNPGFSKSVGGSPANIAIGVAKLGLRSAFIGKVSQDGMGEYITKTLSDLGIHTEGVVYDKSGAHNCLAILEVINPEQSGNYCAKKETFFHGTYLYRENTADILLEKEEVADSVIERARCVLLTGTAFSKEPSRSAMFHILHKARQYGAMTVLDLDYRPFGWTSPEETAHCYQEMIACCDLVIGNREEFDVIEYLTMPENKDNAISAKALLDRGVKTVIVKNGAKGSYGYQVGEETIFRAAIPTRVCKTFGSGDAYAAGLMYGLLNGHGLGESMEMGTANASIALAAGISCSDSMPEAADMLAHRERMRQVWGSETR